MEYSLRELECFAAVAEELSFTRAASRLHLAQPPLSRHIRALEERLGARLFDRSGRKVALTGAGAVFYEETRGALPQLRRAAETTRRFIAGQNERLRLGFVSAVLSPEIVGVLRRFRQLHPTVQLIVHDLPPAEQLEALRGGGLDGGFVGLAPRHRSPGIRFLPWRRENLAAFIPSGHPLAGRSALRLRELAAEPFVTVSREAAPAFAVHLQELCAGAGFRPHVVLEAARAQAVAVSVAAGSGVAILPESLGRVIGDGAVVIPLTRVRPISHVFALNARTPSPPLKLFLQLLSR